MTILEVLAKFGILQVGTICQFCKSNKTRCQILASPSFLLPTANFASPSQVIWQVSDRVNLFIPPLRQEQVRHKDGAPTYVQLQALRDLESKLQVHRRSAAPPEQSANPSR